MAIAHHQSTIIRPTADGRRVEMMCPHCEEWQDVLAFKTLQKQKKHGRDLNTVVRCKCKHVFSPRWLNEES